MSKIAFVAVVYALLGMGVTHAQGMQDSPICYSWNGGNHSSGSFIQCTPEMKAAAVKVAKELPPPVAPSPVMMPMQSCPPPATVTHHIVKHKPRVECKPVH